MVNNLKRFGEAMYGSRWQTDLAAALGVTARTMRRWVAGDTDVPSGVYLDLRRLASERAQSLDDLVRDLEEGERRGAPCDDH